MMPILAAPTTRKRNYNAVDAMGKTERGRNKKGY